MVAKVRYTDAMRTMDPVIEALERYRRDHGCYPPHLTALTPRYLKHLPELPWPFTGSYNGDDRFGCLGGPGYAYSRPEDSYEIITFLCRPGDRKGWMNAWMETLTYEGPGKHEHGNVASIGHVGKWRYVGFLD